jgi:hypothetical protein
MFGTFCIFWNVGSFYGWIAEQLFSFSDFVYTFYGRILFTHNLGVYTTVILFIHSMEGFCLLII